MAFPSLSHFFVSGAEETQQFIRSLIEFIGHFLSRVETDLSLHYSRDGQAHIMDQMEGEEGCA